MAEAATKKYVATEEGGKVASRRFHLYDNCSTLRDEKIDAVTDREIALLGLKGCSVCEKRADGGPAVEALVQAISATDGVIFAPGHTNPISEADMRDAAFNLLDTLKGMGYYVASRKTKDAE